MSKDETAEPGVTQEETLRKAMRAWESLYNERNRLWREACDKLDAIRAELERNGCDCECDCPAGEHGDDCVPCLACVIDGIVGRR